MARPNRSDERREALLPLIADAFVAQGYRRTTTAELAKCCGVQETQLYRLWPDKRAMFLAAIGLVFERTAAAWRDAASDPNLGETPAQRILAHEASHRGERNWYRITFAGLSEADDPDIRKALSKMYKQFHQLIAEQIARQHEAEGTASAMDAQTTAWAVIGVGTITDITKLLHLLPAKDRGQLVDQATTQLLG